MLDNPNEPVSDLSYFDCIESVMENSKVSLTLLLASLLTVGKNHALCAQAWGCPCLKRLVVPLPGCFSNLAMHRNHLGVLLNTDC